MLTLIAIIIVAKGISSVTFSVFILSTTPLLSLGAIVTLWNTPNVPTLLSTQVSEVLTTLKQDFREISEPKSRSTVFCSVQKKGVELLENSSSFQMKNDHDDSRNNEYGTEGAY